MKRLNRLLLTGLAATWTVLWAVIPAAAMATDGDYGCAESLSDTGPIYTEDSYFWLTNLRFVEVHDGGTMMYCEYIGTEHYYYYYDEEKYEAVIPDAMNLYIPVP